MIIASPEERERARKNQEILDRLADKPWWVKVAAIASMVLTQQKDQGK